MPPSAWTRNSHKFLPGKDPRRPELRTCLSMRQVFFTEARSIGQHLLPETCPFTGFGWLRLPLSHVLHRAQKSERHGSKHGTFEPENPATLDLLEGLSSILLQMTLLTAEKVSETAHGSVAQLVFVIIGKKHGGLCLLVGLRLFYGLEQIVCTQRRHTQSPHCKAGPGCCEPVSAPLDQVFGSAFESVWLVFVGSLDPKFRVVKQLSFEL